MNTTLWYLDPNFLVSAIGAFISAFVLATLFWQLRIERARERDRVILANRARVTVRINKGNHGGHSPLYKLVIENHGESEARQVKAMLDRKLLRDHPLVVDCNRDEISVIGPGTATSFLLGVTLETVFPVKAKATWNDGTGEANSFETELYLP